MALVISTISQKGGVGKSTCSRLIAREYAKAGWNVKIADLDISQGTSYDWHLRCLQNDLSPVIDVERFSSVEQALKNRTFLDLLILDGAPHSSIHTLRMAQASDVIVIPSGLSIEDLKPQVLLAHELVKKGIDKARIIFLLCRAGQSDSLKQLAADYIGEAGYSVAAETVPERLAYIRAAQQGKALTETAFPKLNERAARVIRPVIELVNRRREVA